MPTAVMRALRALEAVGLGLLIVGATAWAVLAIYHSDLPGQPLRLGLAATFALCALGAFLLLPRLRALVVFGSGFAAVLLWWLSIEPSNERDWRPRSRCCPMPRSTAIW